MDEVTICRVVNATRAKRDSSYVFFTPDRLEKINIEDPHLAVKDVGVWLDEDGISEYTPEDKVQLATYGMVLRTSSAEYATRPDCLPVRIFI